MELGISGAQALVAASSDGLGFATALALAREGANVSICGRDPERLAAAQERLERECTGRVIAMAIDITDGEAVKSWVRESASILGGLDIVVSNSGGVPFGAVTDFSAEVIEHSVRTNLRPHLCIAAAGLPFLERSHAGRLVMIASESVRQPSADSGISAIARLGVLGLMKGLVDPLGLVGGTVNVIAPGFHRTAALDVQYGAAVEGELLRIAASLPVKRVGSPEDFGSIVAFLASAQAGFITGSIISVDGGKTRGIH